MDLTEEETIIKDVIISSRKVEDFLWGDLNETWGSEEWKRMFRKRYQKLAVVMTRLDNVDTKTNPHWRRETIKRLIQISALSVAMISLLMHNKIEPEVISSIGACSNLPEYSERL